MKLVYLSSLSDLERLLTEKPSKKLILVITESDLTNKDVHMLEMMCDRKAVVCILRVGEGQVDRTWRETLDCCKSRGCYVARSVLYACKAIVEIVAE